MAPSTAQVKKTSGIKPRQTMRGHTDDVSGVVHLPNGRSIITCSRDGSLRRWDLESGAQIGDDWRDEGDEAQVWCIALSPNGKTIASGSNDGTVRLWDVETEKVIAKWAGHTNTVWSVHTMGRQECGMSRVARQS